MEQFDNKIEPTEEQAWWLKRQAETNTRALGQFRDGTILLVDLLNPYRPLYVLDLKGGVTEVHNWFNIT